MFKLDECELVIYEPGGVIADRIENFLYKVDAYFYTSLSSRVNINEYSLKLALNAYNLFYCYEGEDIAHAAFYLNETKSEGFISNIAVLVYLSGRAVGGSILGEVENYLKNRNINEVRLEAEYKADKLVNFYKKYGYTMDCDLEKCYFSKSLINK